ncbi:MAG: hypothetical protein D6742_18430 [Cyanobacteria bacterium J069]|nr:MAG: hypothetical protein D6742_18430 [Cyanobacteria bacterium J069]
MTTPNTPDTPSSPQFDPLFTCAVAFLTSASLTVVLIQASKPSSRSLPEPSPTVIPQPLLPQNPVDQPSNQAELLALRASLAQQEAALSQARSLAQASQLEAQRMKQAADQALAQLRQIQSDGQTLAICTNATNDLIDSIEFKKPRMPEWVEIGSKTADFVRSQIEQDGACRRSRSIARRLLSSAPSYVE